MIALIVEHSCPLFREQLRCVTVLMSIHVNYTFLSLPQEGYSVVVLNTNLNHQLIAGKKKLVKVSEALANSLWHS